MELGDVVVENHSSLDSFHRVFVFLENWGPQYSEAVGQNAKGIFNNSAGPAKAETRMLGTYF